ncbi:MAG: twin-arginine translocase subunit TatC [Verrucomicrobia bacterium]|nr:twin-arginine translocase subunit TatC [Verrucomicrobiota bacterium]
MAPTPVPQSPEGFPSAELDRTSSAGDTSSGTPPDHSGSEPHEQDPYHQEHQHDYGSEYHHDDPNHDPNHADHHAGQHHEDSSHHHAGEYEYPAYTPPPPEEEHGFVKAVRSVTSVLRSDDEPGGEGGGPIKPFLDHLEDLRWMLIKVTVSVLVAMMACLVGANFLVKVLIWPLKEARIQSQQEVLKTNKPLERVPLMLGTNRLGVIELPALGIKPDFNHTNAAGQVRSVQVVPVDIGTNKLLGLQLSTNSPAALDPLVELVILGPLDVIWITIELALFGGLVLAAPFVFYFLGQFILPALRVNEKQFIKPFAVWGTVLFLSGVTFCYFVILPLMLRMTVEFSQWLGFSADQWRAQEYLSMVPKFLLAMGLSFEMPVIILTVVKVGLLDSRKLSWFRSYFIVINLFVCAVVSPSGDPFTMMVMAAPLCVLYEVCILIARFWEWRDRKREKAEQQAGDKA